jgi:hypothetical protein
MRDDSAYRAVVFGALRAVTEDAPSGYVEQIELSTAVNRWAGRNGLGPVSVEAISRAVDRAGYRNFRTERRSYFAGLVIKEDA